MTIQRNSNIELLRIICMLMVMLLHFNNLGANYGLLGMNKQLNFQYINGYLIESLCIVAVNCFVLISGFFGINLKLRSLLKLYLQCFFIGLVSYLLYVYISTDSFNGEIFSNLIFAFSHNRWWFVVSYLGLMLISPLLNSAVASMSKKQLLFSLLGFSISLIYFGWFHNLEPISNGYSLIFLIFLYLVGRYINLHTSLDGIRRYRWLWGIGYLLGSLLLLGLVFLHYRGYNIFSPYHYDHPIVIVNAVLLFLFFLSFKFQSRIINWIASSVFAAYLLQESIYFGDNLLYPNVREFFSQITSCRELWLLVISIGFLLVSVFLDKIIGLCTQPIMHLYDKIVPKSNRT